MGRSSHPADGDTCSLRRSTRTKIESQTFEGKQAENFRKLLLAIIDKFMGGPVGLDNLAAAIGEDRETIEDVLEPFLIQQGFIQRTPRGRIATQRAYDHFSLVKPE